jgi:hypothetical protein
MRSSYPTRLCLGTCGILAALTVLTVPSLAADSKTGPKWSIVTITTIKPDMRSDYEAWQKEITAAFKKADVPSRAVLQTMMGNLFEYISVSPIAHFADMDGPSPIERALGKEGAEKLMRKGSLYVTSAHRLASRELEEFSIEEQASTADPYPYALVTSIRLAAGRVPDFDAWMKNEYLPAMKKAEVKNFWVNQTVFGGDANERVTVRLMKNMAEIDRGPLTVRALGEEGSRKLMSRTAGIIDSVQYRIVRYRPDLSYDMTTKPPATSASAK